MFKWLRKKLAEKWKKRIANNDFKINDKIWIYIPEVDKAFPLIVSSIGSTFFTARFITLEDDSDSRIMENYGQMDNDVKFYKVNCLPVPVKK